MSLCPGSIPLAAAKCLSIIQDLKKQGTTVFSRRIFFRTRKCFATASPSLSAESCKAWARPAISCRGEIQGMEILFEPHDGKRTAPRCQCWHEPRPSASVTGCKCRKQNFTPCSINCRAWNARILSVVPIRPTLEDCCFRLVDASRKLLSLSLRSELSDELRCHP